MSEEHTVQINGLENDFEEIVVNGTSHSNRTRGTPFNNAINNLTSSPSPSNTSTSTVGQKVNTLNLNNVEHPLEDSETSVDIEEVKQNVTSLQQNVTTLSGNVVSLQQDVTSLHSEVSGIENVIPSQASETNKLADKNFVNSTVGTNTANYISNNGQPFTSVAQLEAYSGTVTNNDYAFVTGTDEDGNIFFDRYKATVSGTSVSWGKEYRLNNSSFTAQQWETINSGITALLVQKLESVEDGAEVNTIESISVNGSTVQPDQSKNVNLQVATSSDLAGKLDKSGGTMTGLLNLKGDQYWETNTGGALDAKNSNIVGLNGLVFNDVTDTGIESVIFPKTTANGYTGIFVDGDGNLKLADITKAEGGNATVTGTRSVGSNDGFLMDGNHYLNFDNAIGSLTTGDVYITFDISFVSAVGISTTAVAYKTTVGIYVKLGSTLRAYTSVTGTSSNGSYKQITYNVPSSGIIGNINFSTNRAVKVSNLYMYLDTGSIPTSGFLDTSKVRVMEGTFPSDTSPTNYTLLSPS